MDADADGTVQSGLHAKWATRKVGYTQSGLHSTVDCTERSAAGRTERSTQMGRTYVGVLNGRKQVGCTVSNSSQRIVGSSRMWATTVRWENVRRECEMAGTLAVSHRRRQ